MEKFPILPLLLFIINFSFYLSINYNLIVISWFTFSRLSALRQTARIQRTEKNAFSCMKNSILFLLLIMPRARAHITATSFPCYGFLASMHGERCSRYAHTVYLFSWPYLDRTVFLILFLFDAVSSDSVRLTSLLLVRFHIFGRGDGAMERKHDRC